MTVVFEPSYPPFWCKTVSPSLFHYLHDAPSSSAFCDITVPFMPGPARRAASTHRASPTGSGGNPPRPPNAWILYRSDKLKALPPPPPGMPRQPQADISKTISAMWKTESPEIRAHYERLSDIKKAEHQLRYPDYRFQPMKKTERDRLRAEKLAAKERERGTRRAKARTRASATQVPPPLYTTEARFGPAGPSPPSSGASTPPVTQSSSQQLPTVVPQLTPPADHPTPPGDRPSTPVPPTSSPSPYPPPPATTSIPPLVSPQPGVLQRPPSASAWPQQQQTPATQPNDHEFNALWLEQGPLPDMSHFTGPQQYLRVPIPNHPPHHPLGWSPDDPGPMNNMSFFNGDPLHAVISPTGDPNVFGLSDMDVDMENFDGSREIQISMSSNMLTSTGDLNHLNAFTALLGNLDMSQIPSTVASTSRQTLANEDSGAFFEDFQGSSATPVSLEDFNGYCMEMESFLDVSALQVQETYEDTQAISAAASELEVRPPYVPPAGAANSSTRRVAADWGHIRTSPEFSQSAQLWSGNER